MKTAEQNKQDQQTCKNCGRVVGCDYNGRKCKCNCIDKKIRQAYLTLIKAVQNKPIDKTKTPRGQITQIGDSAHYIRQLQNVGVYLDVVK